MSLLSTHELSRAFGGLKAVDRVNFSIDEGEIHALIGPNGAGKTTFVSLLSGRIEAQAGSVKFAGEDITALSADKRVGKGIAYTFQITSIYKNLSVYENVELAVQSALSRRRAKPSPAEREQLVLAALGKVGLKELTATAAGQLSYGHQRLLEIAMGIALEPRLLILDEPTQGLADTEIDQFCVLLKELSSSITLLIIEHNMSVVMRVADRITVLNSGQLLATGTPQKIRANALVQEAYLGGIVHA